MSAEVPEVIFAEWAARIEAGEDLSFDDIICGHPGLATELRRLHEDWRLFAPLLGRVVPGLIASSDNMAVPPLSSADGDDNEPPSADLLDRLGIHAPNSGRYRFRAVIGRGGGGVVLKVWDTKLNRPLAMKVVLGRGEGRPSGDTPKVDGRTLSRFVDEARIASQLNHPGIVPVHELGADETGRAFFTMKLVRGENLAAVFQHVRSGKDDWNQTRALGVLLRVCEAMAFAHDKGVIHRDLKPANIMVGRYGEVYVMDWGLARVLAGDKSVETGSPQSSQHSAVDSLRASDLANYTLSTRDGDAIGTPAYMPPEQANGDIAQMDERSDVFALGAILCELLTGHPPYTGSQHDILLMASRARLERTYDRLRSMPIDERLRDLALNCLQPIADDRPKHAGEVARTLTAYLASLEQRAHRAEIDAATQGVRALAARRAQRLTLALAVSIVATFMMSGFAAWRLQEQSAARRLEANQQVSRALGDTRTQLGNAEHAPQYDASLWAVALSSAERMSIFSDSHSTDEHLKSEARALGAEVATQHAHALANHTIDERNRALHDELVSIHSQPSEGDSSDADWALAEAQRVSTAYDIAFSHRLGSSLLDCAIDDAVLQLQHTSDPVSIAAALDRWALARDKVRPETSTATAYDLATQRVREAASRLDPDDEWRNALRRLLPDAQNQRAAFEALTMDANILLLPAISTIMLAEALWESGAHDAAVSSLKLGTVAHPADFGLVFQLGLRLQQRATPDWHDSYEAYSVAHALRPDLEEVRHRLAIACENIGKHEQAIALFESLLTNSPDNPEWLRHLASCLIDDGQHDRAATVLRHIATLEPADLHALVSLGHLQLGLGKAADALATFRRASVTAPDSYEPYYGLGVALLRLERSYDAIVAFQRALDIESGDAYLHLRLGDAMAAQGDAVNAEAHYHEAADLDESLTEPLKSVARLMASQGRCAEAISTYKRVLEITPGDTNARILLSFELEHSDADDLAALELLRAAQHNPTSDEPHYWIGRAQLEKGLANEAVLSFSWATELDPNDARNWESLGEAQKRCNRSDEAVASLVHAITLDPQRSSAHHDLGHLWDSQGKAGEALEAYRCAVATASQAGDPEALCHISATMRRSGDYIQALAHAYWALQISPEDSFAHSVLADALEDIGEKSQAMDHLRYVVLLSPQDASAHRDLGRMLLESGSLHEAQIYLSRAVELNPDSPSSYIALAEVSLRMQALDEARYWSDEALALNPTSAQSLHELGHALDSLGRLSQALDVFSRAASINPESEELQRHVGETLLSIGDAAGAQEALVKSVQLIPTSAPLWSLLGRAYRQSGDLAHARSAFEEARRLYVLDGTPDSAEWVTYIDRTLARITRMLSRIESIVAGTKLDQGDVDVADRCDAALLRFWHRDYALAAALYVVAFSDQVPVDVALDHGYAAATAAAIASGGRSDIPLEVSPEQQITLRRSAISWLRARLSLINAVDPNSRIWLTSEVKQWIGDEDLAVVRDERFLEAAPPLLRADAAALWSEVRAFAHRSAPGRGD